MYNQEINEKIKDLINFLKKQYKIDIDTESEENLEHVITWLINSLQVYALVEGFVNTKLELKLPNQEIIKFTKKEILYSVTKMHNDVLIELNTNLDEEETKINVGLDYIRVTGKSEKYKFYIDEIIEISENIDRTFYNQKYENGVLTINLKLLI